MSIRPLACALVFAVTTAVTAAVVPSAPAFACSPYGEIAPTVLADASGTERVRWKGSVKTVEIPSESSETGWVAVELSAWVMNVQLEDDQIRVEEWDYDTHQRVTERFTFDGEPIPEKAEPEKTEPATPSPKA